jgi:formylglycine-generating enzyme required for sulfatase activity
MTPRIARISIVLGSLGATVCVFLFVSHWLALSRTRDAERATFERQQSRAGDMVKVRSFSIDKTEVTVAVYRQCVDDGVCTPPSTGEFCNFGKPDRDAHPINCVDHDQAAAFCAWAGRRLPTRDEWQLAACPSDSRDFPWGSEAPKDQDCFFRHAVWEGDGAGAHRVSPPQGTCPANAHPSGAAPSGALGLAGNVSEWTSTEDAPGSGRFVDIGGNWIARKAAFLGCKTELSHAAEYRDSLLGFRCARGDDKPLLAEMMGR